MLSWKQIQLITSRQNSLVKDAVALRQESRAKREQLILIEGLRHNMTALEAYPYRNIFFSDDHEGEACFQALAQAHELDCDRIRRLAPHIFYGLTETRHSQGVISLVEAPDLRKLAGLEGITGNVLALEECRDPGNLGTIIRTADALGFAGLILLGQSVWPYNSKALRASMGSALYLPVWQAEGFAELRKQLPNYDFLAADMAGSSLHSFQPLQADRHFVLILGNEAHGLSAEAKAGVDQIISIDMSGRAESLNLASATAIMAWQLQQIYR